jgi:hypothetical protein
MKSIGTAGDYNGRSKPALSERQWLALSEMSTSTDDDIESKW